MKYCNIILFFTLSSWVFMQECPPSDTLSIDPIQNMWNIPFENNWDEIEVMTWNIKDFPISGNTINYVNEIISDILPDVIAFQEINNSTAFNTLSSSLPAYDFINSGNGIGATYIKIPTLRIDYIFHEKEINSYNYKTHYNELSDHRAISCEINFQ